MRRASAAVPPALVPPEAARRVASCADLLPATLARVFGYELSLGAGGRVDSAYALTEARPALAHVDALLRERGGAAGPQALDHWRRLRALLEAWADPASIVARGLRVLMLEFDSPEEETAPPLPSPLVFWHATKSWATSSAEHLTLLAEVMRLMQGAPVAAGDWALVERAFRDGYVEAEGVEPVFGVAIPRRPAALRVQLAGMTPERILAVADALGWDGSKAALGRLLERAGDEIGDSLVASFDIAGGVLPRVGIEFIRTGAEQRLEPALRFLQALDLVVPEKARALVEMGEEWQYFAAGETELLGRRPSHYKLAFAGERVLGAKAYLKYTYGPAPARPPEAGESGTAGG